MNRIIINADEGKQKISKHIYGHFAEHLGKCIYEGIWVGEESNIPNTRGMRNDVIEALKKLNMPNLRWPGGCFADTYHWKDGIGPRHKRPGITNIHWGGTIENNHFGTHEFLDFCDLINTEPYICGNVGSGTVQEMAEWLEYITMPGDSPMARLRRKNGREKPWNLTYWAVGNENWGCGGNMTALQYSWEYRKFQTYCRNFSGKPLYKIACGFVDDWNETLVKECHGRMDGISIHHYTLQQRKWTHNNKGSALKFNTEDWHRTFVAANDVLPFLKKTEAILDRHDTMKRIGIILDEWGTWFDVEPGTNPGFLYQQNTVRDALVAAMSLNIFNNFAHRLYMANIAQTINVLQAMILTDGPRMLCTPTYHVFEMFKGHQDATLLPTHVEVPDYKMAGLDVPQVFVSASKDKKGKMLISLCNLHHKSAIELPIELRGLEKGAGKIQSVSARILTGPDCNSHNTFDKPNAIKPIAFKGVSKSGNGLSVDLPGKSVVTIEIA